MIFQLLIQTYTHTQACDRDPINYVILELWLEYIPSDKLVSALLDQLCKGDPAFKW